MWSSDSGDLEAMARALRDSGEYLVLRRLQRREAFADCAGAETRIGLIVDVETTGLDPSSDRIIQLAALPFSYCPRSGRVFTASEPLTFFEDPGFPIPAEISDITRITDRDVAGTRIDEETIGRAVSSAAIVIAHNAAFDRRFVDRRLPVFRGKPWACSFSEVPWSREGLSSGKLEYLLYRHCGMFSDGHRADVDCVATLEVLATPLPSGANPLMLLLESARRRTVRLWAAGAPIEVKELLRDRRYRWCAGEHGRPRAWYRDVPEPKVQEEREWLRQYVYAGIPDGCRTETFDATRRYTDDF